MNEKLRLARIQRHLSELDVCSAIGCDLKTYVNWELGKHIPQAFWRGKLCDFFGMSLADLGYDPVTLLARSFPSLPVAQRSADLVSERALVLSQPSPQRSPVALSTLFDVGVKALLLAQKQEQWSYGELLAQVESAVRRLIVDEKQQNGTPISRRDAVELLVGLPVALLGLDFSGESSPVAEEVLPFCTASIATCWHLSKGKETIPVVTELLSKYLTPLVKLAQQPSIYQQTAAAVASQGYLLAAILAGHRNDFVTREANCKQALEYGELAGDQNLQAAALKTLAATYYYNKRFGKAFQTYQSVLPLAPETSPLIRTHIYVCSAESYARFGQEQEALRYLGLAKEAYPARPEDDPHFLYAECGEHTLALWEGLIRLNLGQSGAALEALNRIDGFQPKVKISERIRIEVLNHLARAATVGRDLDQAAAYLSGAVPAALALGSERRYSEELDVYEQMQLIWPGETQVKRLAELFEQ